MTASGKVTACNNQEVARAAGVVPVKTTGPAGLGRAGLATSTTSTNSVTSKSGERVPVSAISEDASITTTRWGWSSSRVVRLWSRVLHGFDSFGSMHAERRSPVRPADNSNRDSWILMSFHPPGDPDWTTPPQPFSSVQPTHFRQSPPRTRASPQGSQGYSAPAIGRSPKRASNDHQGG